MAPPISNRNFLSPVGFNFVLMKAREVDFFCQSATIPEISMNTATQATRLRNIPVPGDELYYGNLRIRFLVDENMENYLAVHTWMRKLGFPVNSEEYDFETKDSLYQKRKFSSDMVEDFRLKEGGSISFNFETSDAALQILSSSYNVVRTVKFYDLFPVTLSTLEFKADDSDIQYLTAEVTFKYLYFDIT